MFKHMLAPVDLAHTARLGRALDVAADLALHYRIGVTYVAVTPPQPGPMAHSPEEFGRKLEAFAEAEARRCGHSTAAKAVVAHDPSIDLDATLAHTVAETGADLVVMASHVPGLVEYVWPSHGGRLAGHAHVSVMLVRPGAETEISHNEEQRTVQ